MRENLRAICGNGCNRCGKCCIIREKDFHLDPELDYKMRKRMFEKTGVVYLYPLPYYTLSVTHEEKVVMEQEAERLGKKPVFLPKKIIHDTAGDEWIVIDWFLDHDVCPFLEETNVCTIYEKRPLVCRAFPKNLPDPAIHVLEKYPARSQGMTFEEALEKSKILIKPSQIPTLQACSPVV